MNTQKAVERPTATQGLRFPDRSTTRSACRTTRTCLEACWGATSCIWWIFATRLPRCATHRCPVVTASVDQMTFFHPVHVGELVRLKSQENRVFRTSMEVGVKVWVENLQTGEIRHTSSAYLTFVAVDGERPRGHGSCPYCRKRKKNNADMNRPQTDALIGRDQADNEKKNYSRELMRP